MNEHNTSLLPTILFIDDELGAIGKDGKSNASIAICKQFFLQDVRDKGKPEPDYDPIAYAEFFSGRTKIGESPEDCLDAIIQFVEERWKKKDDREPGWTPPWAMILIDSDFTKVNGNDDISNEEEFHKFGRHIVERLCAEFSWESTWDRDKRRGLCDIPLLMLSSQAQKEVEKNDAVGSLGYIPKNNATPKDMADVLFQYGLVADGGLCRVERNVEKTGWTVDPYRKGNFIYGNSLLMLRTLLTARLQLIRRDLIDMDDINAAIKFRGHLRDDFAKLNKRGSGQSPAKVVKDNLKKEHVKDKAFSKHLELLRGPRILILGERGTGKGMIARYLHDHSPYQHPQWKGQKKDTQDPSFQSIQLDGISPKLVESGLFGSVPGAFTDAWNWREGLLMNSLGGTAFIDEIANAGRDVLRKLLSCFGDGTFGQVGNEDVQIPVGCQIVCATNKNVDEMVKSGEFPEDLYDRMTGIIHLPPLRDWDPAECVKLFEHFLRSELTSRSDDGYQSPNQKVLDWVKSNDRKWSGNIRELQILTERVARKRTRSSTIQVYDLEAEAAPLAPASGIRSLGELVELLNNFQPDLHRPEELRNDIKKIYEAFGKLGFRILKRIVSQLLKEDSDTMPTAIAIALDIPGRTNSKGKNLPNPTLQDRTSAFLRGSLLLSVGLNQAKNEADERLGALLTKTYNGRKVEKKGSESPEEEE